MSQLVKFGDVVLKVNDKVDPQEAGLERYVAGEHMVTDDPFLREYGLVGDGYLGPAFQMRFKPGHILYGSRRTYLRKVAMSSFEGVCANTTFVLRPVNDKLAKEFLLHVMSTERFHAHSILQSKGSVNPYINFSDLVDYEFDLPSLDEQARIVELMTAVDEHLDALRSQLEVAKGLRAAVLHQLLSAGGDDWINTTLGDIAVFYNGKAYKQQELLAEGKYRVLRVGNFFSNGNWYWSDLELDKNKYCENGDLLYAWSASFGPRVWSEERVIYHYHIWKIEENHLVVEKKFLYYWLEDDVQRMKRDTGTGSIMMHITKGEIELRAISLPPIVEQRRIVEIVSSMDDVIQATEQAIAEAKVLRTTLLNQEIS